MALAPPRVSSGITGLDDVLGGGFPAGQMYLIEGDPGAGKSTIGLQFLLEGKRRGETCVYVVLAETEHALRRMAESHGWSLDGIHVIESNDQDPATDYSIYHPAEVELGETSRSLLTQLDGLKPHRIVMDSLSEVRLMAQDPLRYRRQLLALRHFFDQREATVLLLDFTSSRDDRQLESLCHGMIRLEQLAPEYGGARRRLRVSKLRESRFRDGYHDFAIETGGIAVYPRLVAAEHHRAGEFTQETTSAGHPRIDALLGGGLDRGTTTLLLGPAGAGKSTLSMQFARAAVERGEKAAFFIFDEVPNTVVVRGEGLGLDVARHVRDGNLRLHQVNPAELSPGKFAHLVRAEVEQHHCSVVVIDSVNGYQSSMPDEHHLSAHLHELLAYLNQSRVVTVMVMTQAGVVGQGITNPIDLSYLADTVVLMRYFEAYGELRQAISAVKRRTGPHERTIRELTLGANGISIGAPIVEFSGVMSGQLVFNGNTGGLLGGPTNGSDDVR